MSYNCLPFDQEELFQNLPSFSRLHNTLLMIETVKNLPNHSLTCLDANINNDHLNQEDSLGEQIRAKEQEVLESKLDSRTNTTDSKKKKTGCTCKKTKCLKMYCECFALGKVCTPECACYSCCNTEGHKDQIEKARNNAKCKSSRKNTQGCTCKKSQCQKKYCECFNAGLACTDACRCQDCQNHVPHNCSSGISEANLDINLKQYENQHIKASENIATPEIGNKIDSVQVADQHQDDQSSLEAHFSSTKNKEKTEIKTQARIHNRNDLVSFGSIDVIKYLN